MNFLYNIIISPIETIVDWVFLFVINKIHAVGVIGAVFGVSLVINFLALPLYNIADRIQEKERNIQMQLSKWVKHIKKHFKGDERFMMLQTYYRENNYHPLYALRSSLSILIEIPFFIAAYHYLSHNTTLTGASWWIFKDLGSPDSLLRIPFGGERSYSINVLPILMTIINFVSGAIYLKNTPLKEKVQIYGLAIVFLFLLYNSPSGLVCYWILNNIFSLFKNIIMKQKNPKKILHIIISVIFISISLFFFSQSGAIWRKCAILLFSAVIVILPFISKLFKHIKINISSATVKNISKNNLPILILSGIGTALLSGFLLPSIIISSSPVEFSFLGNTSSPLSYIYVTLSIFFGFFVFWPCVIYHLFSEKIKRILAFLSFLIFTLALSNAFIFKYDYGIIEVVFNVEHMSALKVYTPFYTILPLCFFAAICIFWNLLKQKHLNFIITVTLILCLAQIPIGIANINKINRSFSELKKVKEKEIPVDSTEIEKFIHLSKTKKNVILLFMDRAIGCYLPYFLDQFPQYKKSFDGFINYENTLSYGAYTLTGSPPMFAGYEYTPEEMAARNSELLVKKHNEATILLPTLFGEKGWFSTIINPPWSNYKPSIEKDFSEFDGMDNVLVKNIEGLYSKKYDTILSKENAKTSFEIDNICRHEIINFNTLQILPPIFRNTFYKNCRNPITNTKAFIDNFSGLYFINEETDFTSETDNYIFYANETIHHPTYLNDAFDYPLFKQNNNTGLYKTYDTFETQLYEVQCAVFIKLANYFDYLRKNNAYDNSRIIIVSDHGYHVNMTHYNNFNMSNVDSIYNFKRGNRQIPNSFACTLMFKDFNCTEPIKNDKTFMTNADAFFLVKEGLDLSEINPFTKKKFVTNKENGINLFFQVSGEIDADQMQDRTQITFDEKTAWHFVPGEINNPKNWIPYKKWKSGNANSQSNDTSTQK